MSLSNLFAVRYKFWPVAQGLFSSCALYVGDRQKFRWVYDCGSSTKGTHVTDALNSLSIKWGPDPSKIDLVIVSHFDTDHISGLVALLKKFSVRTLLLPYAPLWQRLVIGFGDGVDPALMAFLINPVAFIASIEGANVGEILFVRPAAGDGPLPPDAGNPVPPDESNDDDWTIETDRSSGDGEEEIAELADLRRGSANGPAVYFSGKALVVRGVWEFIPYNDPEALSWAMPQTMVDFQKEVAVRRKKLLINQSVAALAELKDCYDRQFGSLSGQTKAEHRNKISLFLYAGPLFRGVPGSNKVTHFNGANRVRRCFHWRDHDTCGGAMHTGDGYMETDARFQRLRAYLKDARIEKIACLQVMHHGSRANWHPGLAKKFSPSFSVFSSDPDHRGYKHPDGEVVRDFLQYNPLHADATTGVEISIEWWYPHP